MVDNIDSFLYNISLCTKNLYTPQNISLHVEKILNILQDYKQKGFISEDYMENNVI
jgi:hypothetical protein